MITPMLIQEWQAHPVTKKILKILHQARTENVQHLTDGYFMHRADYATQTAKLVGIIQGIDLFFLADLLNKDEDEEKTVMA